MGSDESRFNVSLMDKVTGQCPQTTHFEEKGEPKRIRTEVLLLTSLTPYRWAKPAHWWYRERESALLYALRFPSRLAVRCIWMMMMS